MSIEPYKVSILIPVYGVEKFIGQCARSAFSQTYRNIEYIFVDDCSPDQSIKILQSVISQFPDRQDSVKIMAHDKNRGLAAARNTAIENATGTFVYHLDSDDYIEEDTITLLVEKQLETNADIVSAFMYVNQDEKKEAYIEPKYPNKELMLKGLLGSMLHHEICGRLIRKDLYINNSLWSIDGLNHGEGWLALARLTYFAQKVDLVDKFLYHYVMNEDSYCHSFKDWDKEKLGLEQGQKNMFALKAFFADKEKIYADLLIHTCVGQIFYRLIRGLEERDLKYYGQQYTYLEEYPFGRITEVAGKKMALILKMTKNPYILIGYLNLANRINRIFK